MLLAGLLVLCATGCGELKEAYYQDFRGAQFPPETVMSLGKSKGEQKSVKRDTQGILISLKKGLSGFPPYGVTPKFWVHGDFEITVAYDLIHFEKPTWGSGVGFGIWVMSDTSSVEAASITRMNRVKDGNVYVVGKGSWSSSKGRYFTEQKSFPTDCKAGKLRLVRASSIVRMLVSEGNSEEFRELWQFPFNGEDLSQIHVGVTSGDKPNSLDVRLLDLRIRAEELPFRVSRKKTQWTWMIWLLAGVGGTGLVVGAVVWRWRRTLNPAGTNDADDDVDAGARG